MISAIMPIYNKHWVDEIKTDNFVFFDDDIMRARLFFLAGRLHQVEYAVEAINNAGTAVGILAADGIVLAGEKQAATKLIAPSKSSEKTYKLDDHVACIVAGLSADANILIQQARVTAQRYLYTYQEPMPIEQLTQRVCNQKQAYTQCVPRSRPAAARPRALSRPRVRRARAPMRTRARAWGAALAPLIIAARFALSRAGAAGCRRSASSSSS